jgi:hypothetical protein
MMSICASQPPTPKYFNICFYVTDNFRHKESSETENNIAVKPEEGTYPHAINCLTLISLPLYLNTLNTHFCFYIVHSVQHITLIKTNYLQVISLIK